MNPVFGQTLKSRRALKHPDKCSPRMWSERDAIHGDWWSGTKNSGGSWFAIANNTVSGHSQNPVTGLKGSGGEWFGGNMESPGRKFSSRSTARKAKSAEIAEIPPALAAWIAKCFKPECNHL